MTKTKSRLRKCPFCKSMEVYYEVDMWDVGYITCYSCGACGPRVDAKRGANSKATRLWNEAKRDDED